MNEVAAQHMAILNDGIEFYSPLIMCTYQNGFIYGMATALIFMCVVLTLVSATKIGR